MVAVRGLGYVVIESPQLESWEEFGREMLSMETAHSPEGDLMLKMDDRSHRIVVRRGPTDRLHSIGWELADRGAFGAAHAELAASGVDVRVATAQQRAARRVLGLLTYVDPAGFETELFYGLHEQPGSYVPRRSGYVTGRLGLGHLALIVPDLDTYCDYLEGALGFRLSDEYLHDGVRVAAFWRCNPRHHSLTVASVPGQRGLHHLMLQVNELDDVGLVSQIAAQRSLLSAHLGRHTNDRMLSCYVITPSDFPIEYGWGGREVDDDTWVVSSYTDVAIWGHEKTRPETMLLEPAGAVATGTVAG